MSTSLRITLVGTWTHKFLNIKNNPSEIPDHINQVSLLMTLLILNLHLVLIKISMTLMLISV